MVLFGVDFTLILFIRNFYLGRFCISRSICRKELLIKNILSPVTFKQEGEKLAFIEVHLILIFYDKRIKKKNFLTQEGMEERWEEVYIFYV